MNSETDFVAKNEIFQEFVRNVASLALQHGGDVEVLGASQYPGGGGYAAFAFNVGYARAMLQAALTV